MKPKTSRFDQRPDLGDRDAAPAGGLPHLDVEGQVELDGERAVAVTLGDRRLAFDPDGCVVVAGARYRYVRLGGRAALVPV